MLQLQERGFVAGLGLQGASARGVAAGSRVATALGWRAVEALAEGDLVLTFDHGLQPLAAVRRRVTLPGDEVVLIPEGALGNTVSVIVAAEQAVLVESDLAEALTGDPFVLIEAGALVGWRDIAFCHPTAGAMLVDLAFDGAEAVFCKSGAILGAPDVLDLGQDTDVLRGARARDFATRLMRHEP